jgi:hypothetical protein
VDPRAGLDGCGKSHPTRIRSLDREASSEWLYRLSYRGPSVSGVVINSLTDLFRDRHQLSTSPFPPK